MIDQEDLRHIQKRRWFVDRWSFVGTLLLTALVGLLAWLRWFQPRLVSPVQVARELQTGAISQTMLETMAVLLPVVVLALFGLTAVVIVYGFFVFRNERRYLRIIDELRRVKEGAEDDAKSRAQPSDAR